MASEVLKGQRPNRQAGFTLLELTVVVVVISVLFLFAYQRYLDLLVDVEKASVEQTLGILRSAVGMTVARKIVDGNPQMLRNLEGTNPVDLLSQVPKSYLGEDVDSETLKENTGVWYFDRTRGLLVYQVKNIEAFYSEIPGLKQARFRLVAVYDDERKTTLVGLSLRPIEKYSWFKKTF